MNTTPGQKRRLIICCDGTWNKPESSCGDWDEKEVCTNVLKTVRSIEAVASDGTDQIVYYESGVGTGGIFDRFVGGFAGYGIKRNIERAYRFLANNYRDGDEIWCFGFSRGAFTVRSLIGLINTVGLVRPQDMQYFPHLYAYYRKDAAERKKDRHREQVSQLREKSVKPSTTFLGVWDTVGALGAPTPLLGPITRWLWVGFHDTEARNILYAYHALAIDERRKPFAPSVWTKKDSTCLEMQQVWFPGAHSNVGGGYSNTCLSDTALRWMLRHAELRGLELRKGWDSIPDEIDPRWDVDPENSFKLYYRIASFFYGWKYPRPLAGKHRDVAKQKYEACDEFIHESAVKRHEKGLKTYNPDNLRIGVEKLKKVVTP
jgi:uncharacterized protein (DUF2235 family)